MRRSILAAGAGLAVAGAAALWWLAPSITTPERPREAPTNTGAILYYQDASGAPAYSATPKKDEHGRDYIAVRAPGAPGKPLREAGERRILYYRNPMGLPDTSPVPKKDSMGMDYITVYADEASEAPGSVRVSLDRVQRLGVRTQKAEPRVLNESVVLAGTLTADERKLAVVALKFPANITKLHVAATGERVRAGEPLFEIQSPFLLKEELDLALALRNRAIWKGAGGAFARASDNSLKLTRERLQLYEVPRREIDRLIRTQTATGRVIWPAPQDGTVLEKPIVAGMRAEDGQVLYRIADLTTIWLIADAPEMTLPIVEPGATARITLSAIPGRTFDGKVTFIYPEIAMATRTARVRIELANEDGSLMPGMFASVKVVARASKPVLAVPDSALIDSGERQVVIVARGEGLFEPRAVEIGRRAANLVEIRKGLESGEDVVTSATFLIDAESNLRAALQSFTAGEVRANEAAP